MAKKLYDKEGHLIPLCLRCVGGNEFFPDDCPIYDSTKPEHWHTPKVSKCQGFSYENWWKVKNLMYDKPSEFPTFEEPPIKGDQNTSKGSHWFKTLRRGC